MLAAFAVAMSLSSNIAVLVGGGITVLALFAAAGLTARSIFAALRPALVLIIFLAGLQWAFQGWLSALTTTLRILDLILAAALVSYTTRYTDLIACLIAAARPLRVFGLPPEKIGLALALAMRFIPTLVHEFEEIKAARIARCARRFGYLSLGILILNAIRMADEVSDAVLARGFEERDRHDR